MAELLAQCPGCKREFHSIGPRTAPENPLRPDGPRVAICTCGTRWTLGTTPDPLAPSVPLAELADRTGLGENHLA